MDHTIFFREFCVECLGSYQGSGRERTNGLQLDPDADRSLQFTQQIIRWRFEMLGFLDPGIGNHPCGTKKGETSKYRLNSSK